MGAVTTETRERADGVVFVLAAIVFPIVAYVVLRSFNLDITRDGQIVAPVVDTDR